MAELASGYRKVAPEAIPDLIAWLGRCLAVRQEQPNSPLWRTSVLQFADVLDHALLLDWPHHLLPLPSSPPSASSASLASRPPSSPGRSEADPKSLKKNGSAAAGPLGEAEAAVRSDSCAAVEETKGLCAHEQQQQQLQQQQQSVALSGATATWDPAVRQRFWKELVALYEGVVRGMCAGEGVMRGMGTGEWQSGSVQTLPPAQVHEDEVLQERMVRLLGEKVLRYCQDAPLEVKQRLVGLLLDLAERAVGEVQLIGVGHGRGSSGHIGSEKGEAPSKAAATAPASNGSLAATGSNARILPPATSTASHRAAPDRSRSFSTPAVSVSPLRTGSGPTPASASASAAVPSSGLGSGSGAGSGVISGSLSGGQGPRGEGKAAAPLSGLARVGSWLGWGAAGGAAAGGGQGGRAEQVKATDSVGRGGSDGFSGNDGHAVVRTRSSSAIAAGSGSRGSDGEMDVEGDAAPSVLHCHPPAAPDLRAAQAERPREQLRGAGGVHRHAPPPRLRPPPLAALHRGLPGARGRQYGSGAQEGGEGNPGRPHSHLTAPCGRRPPLAPPPRHAPLHPSSCSWLHHALPPSITGALSR
ncbi:unnamed protein product [Closterium sp. NIES-54]